MTAGRLRLVARLGTPSRRSRWFVGSLAAHLAVVALVTLWPAERRPIRGPIGPSMAVDLVAGVPGARPSVSRARAPEPEPPKVEVPKPKPKPKPPPEEASLEPRKIEITKKPTPEPEPVDEAGDADATPEDVDVPTGDATGPADGGPGDGGVAGDVGGGSLIGSEYAWYSARVTAALRSQWRRPPLGNVRRSLTVIVGFEIQRNGAVRNPRVLESSGVPSLDRSALRAVVDAQPLPALPRGITAAVVPARFEFTWYPGDS